MKTWRGIVVLGLTALACNASSRVGSGDQGGEGNGASGSGAGSGTMSGGASATGGAEATAGAQTNGGTQAGGGAQPTGGMHATGGNGSSGVGGCPATEPGVCDSTRCPTLPAEATTCSAGGSAGVMDMCGCADAGACEAGSRCVTVFTPAMIGFGGPGTSRNVCATGLCDGDTDCTNGMKCLRDGQGLPVCSNACRFDSECVADCGGRCVTPSREYHAGFMVYEYSASSCVYPGACTANSCASCSPVATGAAGSGSSSIPGSPSHRCGADARGGAGGVAAGAGGGPG